MRKKLTKGVTLVEMLIALAILGIVLIWVAHFMITGTKLFSGGAAQSSVQNEVQLATNQISDMLKSSQLGVSLGVKYAGETEFVMSDAGMNADEKYLFVFNWDNSGATVEVTIVRWNAEDKRIYLSHSYGVENSTMENAQGETVSSDILHAVSNLNTEWELLADHITNFSVDMSAYTVKNNIDIAMKSEKQGKSYSNKTTTVIRNNIILNASSINELYELAGHIVTTVIKGINLTAPGSSTIPSGRVQLSTMVTGEGYPSQIIYKWKIVKVEAGNEIGIVYDSLSGATASTYVDSSTKVLNVADNMEAAILRIYAYADTRSSNEDYVNETVDDKSKIELVLNSSGAIKTILIYDYVDISVRNIESFTIQPVPDLNLEANDTLKDLVNDFAAITMTTPGEVVAAGVMDVYPGNVIPMSVSITGKYLTEEDRAVYWTLDSETSNVAVTLSENGTLLVNKYSNAGRCVITAHSALDSRIALSYVVNIGDAFAEGNNILEIVSSAEVNRAAKMQLGLKLNDEAVPVSELSNFNWSVKVTNSAGVQITNNPASITSAGLLSVSETLSYDYSFNVNITVSMKNNPSIYATKRIVVPRINITLSCSTYLSERGKTIPYGEITANVTGIERGSYKLTWSIAKETNPTYYTASYTTGTNVTADRNDDRRCKIVISGSEAESLTYMRVRVQIVGHTNYSSQCRIVLTTVDIKVSCDKSSIYRSSTGSSKAKFTASSTQTSLFSPSEIKWEIESVKVGTTVIKKYDGLVLTKTATGAELYALDTFYPTTEDVQVTVKGSWGSFSSSHTVTVGKITFNVSGNTVMNRGDTITLTASDTFGSNIEWSVTSISNGTSSDCTLTPGGSHYINTQLYVKPSYDTGNHSGDKIVVTAHVMNTNLSATYTIDVNPVVISVAATSTKFQYTATVTGLPGASISWKISSSDGGSLVDSLTGVTMSASGSTVTFTVANNAPQKFYLYARATKSGTTFTSSATTVSTSNFVTPTSLSYSYRTGTSYYVCEFGYYADSSGWSSTKYYHNAIRGKRATKDGITYWQTNLGTRTRRNGSLSYSGDTVYYAYDSSSSAWFVYEGNVWNEISSSTNIGTTSYRLTTILEYMTNNRKYSS